jgi:phosphohistidine phosphatase
MKTLLIMRHAKSGWKNGSMPDHDRPLTKRGKRDAPRMGQRLQAAGLRPDVIITSTAERARSTATAAAEGMGFTGEVQTEAKVYDATPEAYFTLLRGLPAEVQTAMVVGHNPGLQDLLAELTGESHDLPTAAIAQVKLPIDSWADLNSTTEATLADLWQPREPESSE